MACSTTGTGSIATAWKPLMSVPAKMRTHADKLEQLAPASVEALLAKARSAQLERDWPRPLHSTRKRGTGFPAVSRRISFMEHMVGLRGPSAGRTGDYRSRGRNSTPCRSKHSPASAVIAHAAWEIAANFEHVVERALEISPESAGCAVTWAIACCSQGDAAGAGTDLAGAGTDWISPLHRQRHCIAPAGPA